MILDFWSEEYRSDKTEFPPETDLHHVGLAYSTAGDNDEHEIQVEADLIDYAINYYADGVLVLQEKWDKGLFPHTPLIPNQRGREYHSTQAQHF